MMMKATTALALMMGTLAVQAVDRYVALDGGHVPPFTSWAEAATNIQDAIDASVAGDTVWVTNGLYNTGGKVMAGDLTNRVALDKAITLQSVNGPQFTIIEGAGPVGTNAVRCAWLASGATLSGFTLQGGTTRSQGDETILQSGGGIWCESTRALVTNSFVKRNEARSRGGGIYGGTIVKSKIIRNSGAFGAGVSHGVISHCHLIGNQALASGGGAYRCILTNCAAIDNFAGTGGGTDSCSLYNCTVTRNQAMSIGGSFQPSSFDLVRNSIIYGNKGNFGPQSDNYDYHNPYGIFQNCCTTPLPFGGLGNIASDPRLLSDGVHLAEDSPCRGLGSAVYATGTDIDGQFWMTPPSMGCDEWHPEPVVVGAPAISHLGGNAELIFDTLTVGATPFTYGWVREGAWVSESGAFSDTDTANLRVRVDDPLVAGGYALVASNAHGMVTGIVTKLRLHYVDGTRTTPVAPYLDWVSATPIIQEAVDASVEGDVVVVTNGTYATGGRSLRGEITNRVAVVDKDILILSVNGPEQTVIQGAWDPVTTNGPLAVRCVKLSGFAVLKGFTLRGGATAAPGHYPDSYGGGASSGYLADCKIVDCAAGEKGGGAYGVLGINCEITRNFALQGGGAAGCWLTNCTITANSATDSGGGTLWGTLRNSIVYFNSAPQSPNAHAATLVNSCSTPLPPGSGNIGVDPQLLDGGHLLLNSPCRGMGSSLHAAGTDIDDQFWLNPPSMGCDEVYEADFIGPLAVAIEVSGNQVVQGVPLTLTGWIDGRAASLAWDFGDGGVVTDVSYITAHSWAQVGDYTVTFTAYNADHPVGVGASTTIHVAPLELPQLTVGNFTNTSFRLEFPSQPGVSYVVEQATNLASPVVWSTVTTRTGSGGLEQVTDSKATNDLRFYRIRVP